jgi:hypothetical protein
LCVEKGNNGIFLKLFFIYLNREKYSKTEFQSSDEPAARPDLLPGQPGERAAPPGPVRRDRPELQPRQTEAPPRAIHSEATLQVKPEGSFLKLP